MTYRNFQRYRFLVAHALLLTRLDAVLSLLTTSQFASKCLVALLLSFSTGLQVSYYRTVSSKWCNGGPDLSTSVRHAEAGLPALAFRLFVGLFSGILSGTRGAGLVRVVVCWLKY